MTTDNLLESEEIGTLDTIGREGRASVVAKKFRVQLDFEPGDMAMINRLVEELGLSTRAELFRSSLRALRWMVEKKKQGCVVLAVTADDRYIQPEFDFLDGLTATPSGKADGKPTPSFAPGAKPGATTRKTPAHA